MSAVMEDKKSQLSSLDASRITGCKTPLIEENLTTNRQHRFKDRPESIAHEVMVDALK